jgi:hypothetical protein
MPIFFTSSPKSSEENGPCGREGKGRAKQEYFYQA